MKLELKHLSGYLPHNLRLSVIKSYSIGNGFWVQKDNEEELEPRYLNIQLTHCKPILRPLSALTKDEYNFIYENETDYQSIYEWIKLDSESRLCSKFSYMFWDELFHYHFDVFGLIEAGLAIDINT